MKAIARRTVKAQATRVARIADATFIDRANKQVPTHFHFVYGRVI